MNEIIILITCITILSVILIRIIIYKYQKITYNINQV